MQHFKLNHSAVIFLAFLSYIRLRENLPGANSQWRHNIFCNVSIQDCLQGGHLEEPGLDGREDEAARQGKVGEDGPVHRLQRRVPGTDVVKLFVRGSLTEREGSVHLTSLY
jgi:hypothetical protein